MNLKIRLANSEEIEAPIEVWVASVIMELPSDTAARIFERLRKRNVVFSTPGSHVLRAEGASLSALLRGPFDLK